MMSEAQEANSECDCEVSKFVLMLCQQNKECSMIAAIEERVKWGGWRTTFPASHRNDKCTIPASLLKVLKERHALLKSIVEAGSSAPWAQPQAKVQDDEFGLQSFLRGPEQRVTIAFNTPAAKDLFTIKYALDKLSVRLLSYSAFSKLYFSLIYYKKLLAGIITELFFNLKVQQLFSFFI